MHYEGTFLSRQDSCDPINWFNPPHVCVCCTRLAAASDKVYQLLAHGLLFSTGTLTSSTTKTVRHNIAEMLLKVVLNTKNQIKTNHQNKERNSYYGNWWNNISKEDKIRNVNIDNNATIFNISIAVYSNQYY
jgi:hypothetical protein